MYGFPEPERDALTRYFEKVANRNGWKKPINVLVTIKPEEIPMLRHSIEVYTGSKFIEITEENPGEYRVIAEGFYNALGDL